MRHVGAAELWAESYQGEVLGEAFFGALAEREGDPARRHQLEMLTLLERSTKELAEPVFERSGIDRGDSATTLTLAHDLAEGMASATWEDMLASIIPIAEESLVKYRTLVGLVPDAFEREIAEAYVAHEEALVAFVLRSLGQEEGDPLAPILALPHVLSAA